MRFVPIDEVEKEEPSGFRFVPLGQETPATEQEVKGVKEETKKGESVLAGTTLTPGAELPKKDTFKLPGFEHLYPSEESPFNLSEQSRTEKLIMQGLDPEFARATARRNIAEGKPTTGAEYGVARETPEEVQLAESLKYVPGKTGIEDTAQVLKRAGVKAVTGMAQAGGGMQRFVGEMLDLDTSDETKTLDAINTFTQSMGEAPSKPVQIIEGAFNSIGQQLPALVAGAATGSQPLVLASMFANSFGQNYDDSRRRDLDAVDSTARAAAYAAFEVIGEKFGLGDQLTALKKLATGVPEKDLAGFFAKALAKEIPGEQLTYAGQFAVDKGFGLNPEAGLKEFIQGAIDTMLVTATQGGIMLGGGMTMNKLVGGKGGKKEEPEIKTTAELTKEKGFTFVPLGQTKEEVVSAEPTPGIFAKLKQEYNSDLDRLKQKWSEITTKTAPVTTAEGEPETDARQKFYEQAQARYQQLGLTRQEAAKLANQDLEEAGYGARFDTRTGEPGVSVPSEQPTTTAGVTEPVGAGVGRDSQAAVLPTGGAEAQPSTLGPIIQDGIKRYAETLTKNKVKDTDTPATMGGRADAALRKVIDNIETKLRAAGVSTERDAQGNMELENIIYQQLIPAARKQVFAEKEAVAPTITAPAVAEVTPIAPTVTRGKPRGRPKAELTAEEAAAKKAAKAEQTKEWKATNKQLMQAQQVLDLEPPVREDFQDQDSYLDAGMRYRTERQAALDLLNGMATGARRNTALGKRAQEGLAHPSITPQELAAVKEREAVRKGTARAELLEATNGVENDKYAEFSTGGQALSWIAKNGNEFESTLAKRILPFVRNMKVVIVRSPADLPTNYLRKQFDGAAGMYSNGVIYLDANGGMNNTVFLHEALHGATIDRINRYLDDIAEGREPEAKLAEAVERMYALMKSSGRLYDALNKLGMTDARTDALARAEAFTDVKEFVAYGMSNPAMQEFLLQAPGTYAGAKASFFDGIFNRFVQTIRSLFNMGEKHNSAMQDLIIVTDKLLATDIGESKVTKQEAAAAKKQTQKFDADQEKIRLSNTSTNMVGAIGESIENHSFDPIKDLLNARFEDLGNGFIKKTLYTMQTADILRWKGKDVPALVEVDNLTQEMSAMRMRMMAASAKKADALAAFIRKNGSVALSNTMHLARLKKVSPTEHATAADAIKADPIIQQYERLNADPNTDPADIPVNKGMITRRTNQINSVYAAWDVLGKQKGGHEMYKMVRQFYQDAYTTTRSMLNEQIDALPIDAAAKAKLLKSVRLMHEKSVGADTETVLDEDGTPFAEVSFKTLPEDYFPFKRYGEYWLRVEGGPAGREFYLFENGKDRNLFQIRRARELGVEKNDPNVFSKGDDIHALRKNFQDSSIMLQEMFANIDQATGDARFDPANFASQPDPAAAAKAALDAYKDELKDQLYQTYLMTMPERSFRKQFIHAEKVTGFSADVLRNFKTSATAYANQLAKLKYGTEIGNTIQRARDTLQGMPADMRGRMELFVNEMDKRAQAEVNPPEDSAFAAGLNQFAFIMLLTGAASAATQMASIPIMVMPTLSEQYGYGKASVELAKLMPIWKSVGVTQKDSETGEVTYTAPSLASSDLARKNPNLNRAFQEAAEKYNLFNLTNTSVITDSARTPDNSPESMLGKTGKTITRGMTALFTGSERMSREISFAMTFNLEFAKTGNFDESVQKAVQTTHELLGRYDNMNRPRVLRNFAGRTIGQFKMYSIFMTSWFVRNANTVFREGLGEAEGRAAAQRLAGTLIMGSLFHGLVGMPMYSVITAVIDALSDEEDEEVKKRLAKNPLTAMNSNFRFRYEFLPKYFGEITIPGLDGRQHSMAEILEKGPISALTDINFSSRTSFDGMWWREAKPGKTYLETAQNIIMANLGPGVSTGFNMVGAIDDFSNGKIQRGLEKLVPAFFRGSLVATRLGTEGAETKGGDKLLKREEINTLNLIAAATGFQPTRLARIQEKNFAIQKEVVEASTKRIKLLRRLNEIVLDDKVKGEDIRDAIKDIVEYNKRYPMEKFLIEPDTIRKSLETLAEKRGMTIRGQYMDKKLAPYVYPSTKAVTPIKEEQKTPTEVGAEERKELTSKEKQIEVSAKAEYRLNSPDA